MAHMFVRKLKLCGGILSLGFGLVYLQSGHTTENKFDSILKHAYEKKPFKVAIIGSGIGGSSAAHFTRELHGSSVSIDVFEKSNLIGGRAAVISVEGKEYESGGSIIHDDNRYLSDFVKLAGLTKLRALDTGNMILGIYDGNEFVFKDSDWKIVSLFRLFWRYGFSLITMNRFLEGVLKDFGKIYKLQDEGKSFTSVEDMLTAMGGIKFVEYTQKTAREILIERGVNQRIVDELATAVTRCNYGQNMDVSGFVGLVSLAGAQSEKLWMVKGGNYQVCHRILDLSQARVFLNKKVNIIKKVTDEDGTISYQLIQDNGDLLGTYDSVIVAAPLEVPGTAIKCEGCSSWPKPGTTPGYQQTVATFIVGNISHNAFGYDRIEDVPEEIFTIDNKDLFFRTIGVLTPTDGTKYDKHKVQRPLVYKFFSGKTLTNAQINTLFDSVRSVKAVTWLAYPKYSPPEHFAPFALDSGIFYVNAIERAASALEMSALSGRNAALLCKRFLDKKASTESPGKLHSQGHHSTDEL